MTINVCQIKRVVELFLIRLSQHGRFSPEITHWPNWSLNNCSLPYQDDDVFHTGETERTDKIAIWFNLNPSDVQFI